jgi:hypothetical protein
MVVCRLASESSIRATTEEFLLVSLHSSDKGVAHIVLHSVRQTLGAVSQEYSRSFIVSFLCRKSHFAVHIAPVCFLSIASHDTAQLLQGFARFNGSIHQTFVGSQSGTKGTRVVGS